MTVSKQLNKMFLKYQRNVGDMTYFVSADILYTCTCSMVVVTESRLYTQLQVGESCSYLFNTRRNICKYLCLNVHFILDDTVVRFADKIDLKLVFDNSRN